MVFKKNRKMGIEEAYNCRYCGAFAMYRNGCKF